MDLSGHNSFRMKVSCRNFLEYDCAADLEKLDFEAMEGGVKHIGGGSNLLFTAESLRWFVSALNYFPGPSPGKYLRLCRA